MESRFFEDFALDQSFVSRGRTVTEADVVNFAGLSGDFVELHVNERYASESRFGRRIAHGALVFSMSTGMSVEACAIHRTVLAFYGIDKLRFTRPVFIGDTIHTEKRVLEKQTKDAGGVLTFETRVINQTGDIVLVYNDKMVLRIREQRV